LLGQKGLLYISTTNGSIKLPWIQTIQKFYFVLALRSLTLSHTLLHALSLSLTVKDVKREREKTKERTLEIINQDLNCTTATEKNENRDSI